MNKYLLSEQQIRENTDYYYPNSKAMERRLNKMLLAQHKKSIGEFIKRIEEIGHIGQTDQILLYQDEWQQLKKEVLE